MNDTAWMPTALKCMAMAQAKWGVEVRKLSLGIGDFPIPWIADNLKLFISALDLTAGVVALSMIVLLTLLFKFTASRRFDLPRIIYDFIVIEI